MSIVREFKGLLHFAHFLEEQTAAIVPTGQLAIGAAGDVLYRNVRKMYGDHRLPELAEATQAERERLGFTPDDPLLRDGSKLRDAEEFERGPDFVAVGNADPVAAYSEFGFVNARTGEPVPPRAVHREALKESIPQVAEIVHEIVGVQLGVAPLSARLVELSATKPQENV